MADITAAKATLTTVSSSVDKERLNKWAFLCLFSVLALIAHQTDDMVKHTYITVCSSSSIVFSGLASFAHVGTTSISALFVGTVIEGLVSLIVVCLWAAALPIIMNPANGLAQMYVGKAGSDVADYQATIANANLFFTSWGAGVCALSVLAMYIRESFGGAGGMGMSYTAYWYLLMLTSVIVIIESATFKDQVCGIEGGTEDVTCARNTYGLVTGEYEYSSWVCDLIFPRDCFMVSARHNSWWLLFLNRFRLHRTYCLLRDLPIRVPWKRLRPHHHRLWLYNGSPLHFVRRTYDI